MTARLTVACWKWRAAPGYRTAFDAGHVNTLRRMVARHYDRPHDFACITDDPAGLDPGVRVIPLWDDLAGLPNPRGRHLPSCYRRLKAFSDEAAALIGPRFVSLDLDVVIVGDMTPLWDRPEDFVIWGGTAGRSGPRRTWYNGSMFLLTAGARRAVWDDFDPVASPAAADAAGQFGSDQGWIAHRLGPGQPTWTAADGVYSWRVDLKPAGGALPAGARIVIFHGKHDPWHDESRRAAPWIDTHYR